MPFRRSGSPYWQVRKYTLPGFGDTGVLVSGVRDRKTAEKMERCLEVVASMALSEPRYGRLLEAVRDRAVSLSDLYAAHTQHRLGPLVASLTDVPLAHACEEARRGADRQAGIGLDKLLAHFGKKARTSALLDARALEACLRACEATGSARNTVRRQVYRAISRVLTQQYGRAERSRITADVYFPATDDTREVYLSREEITRLLECCEAEKAELKVIVLAALLTGADRGVLLAGHSPDGARRGLLCGDVAIHEDEWADGRITYRAEISLLHDTKASGRSRTVACGDRLARALLVATRGRADSDPVFAVRYEQLDYLWKRARKAAGLPTFRFKDLRAQYAAYAEEAGLPGSVVSRSMGHADEAMTARYRKTRRSLSFEQVQCLEDVMLAA